jgi:two-component system, NarL family, response regulator NreC
MGVRLLIAAEHALVAEGFAQLVGTQPDFEVIGRATTNEKLIARCRAGPADVAIIDTALLTLDGLEVVRHLRRQCQTRLLVLSNNDDTSVVRALRARAMGCIPKSASAEDFFAAIRRVHSGEPYFPMELTPALLKQLSEQPPDPLAHLSARERQVLQLVASGLSSKAIGQRLALSPKSVDTYRSRIMAKIGVRDAIGLVKFAILHGVVSLDQQT